MNNDDEDIHEKGFIMDNILKGTHKNYKIALRYYKRLISKTTMEFKEETENEEIAGILTQKRKLYKYPFKYKKIS